MTKQQKIWILTGAAAAVIAVICCACAITGYVWWTGDDADDVVDDYLSAVQEHDQVAAGDLVCDAWRSGVAGKIRDLTQIYSEIVDWKIDDVDEGDRTARVTAAITYRLAGNVNTSETTFTLVKEDGDWRVCGINSR